MSSAIHIVVPGPPPRKNARGTIARSRKTGKPIRITPKKTKAWRLRLYDAVVSVAQRKDTTGKPLDWLALGIRTGRWSLGLDVFEDEMRHLDVDVPCGDIDSSVSAVLDALQPKKTAVRGRSLVRFGLLDDDARVVSMTVRKHYDKANPRVEITLTEIE